MVNVGPMSTTSGVFVAAPPAAAAAADLMLEDCSTEISSATVESTTS